MKTKIQCQKYYDISYKELAKKLNIKERIIGVRSMSVFFGGIQKISIQVTGETR